MRLQISGTILASCLFAGMTSPPARAQTRTAPRTAVAGTEAAKLPVRRVVLYKNGVGYFEHLGRVRGNQSVSIDFTSGQLNDVLKSLTILDLNGGHITAVDYNSEAPLTRRLGALRLPVGEKTTVKEFLGALAGARLEVRTSAGAISGRLLSVETRMQRKDNAFVSVDQITLVTDSGEVRTADLGAATSVRILESDLNREVGRYLGLLASSRQQDLRRMVISTAGAGERQLYVSYISEVPIWKTTYRLVLPSKPGAKPLLQGWAIVDNTVGEDWNNVEMSLVAGAPQSFIQQLSQPYYARRPVVPLPESVQLTPQTHEATLVGGTGRLSGEVTDPSGATVPNAAVRVLDENNNVVAQTMTDEDGDYEIESLPVGNYRVEVSKPGFQHLTFSGTNVAAGENTLDARLNLGAVNETVTVQAGTDQFERLETTGKASRGVIGGLVGGVGAGQGGGVGGGDFRTATLEAARRQAAAAAHGRELGDLFEYKLTAPVTIHKNQSALVPILQTEIRAEKVSLWNASLGSVRPLRAVWLTNSSPLTLDGGSFSVLEGETFAGEGLLDPVKPGEKRLLSYAADLGMLVDTKTDSEQERVTRVLIRSGVMAQTRELRERKTYTVRNEDTSPRALVIEHPRRAGWKLGEGPKPEETTADFYRFRLQVEPKKTATLAVNETRPMDLKYSLSNLTDKQIGLFVQQRSINPEIEQALRRVLAQKDEVARLAAEVSSRRDEVTRIFSDQGRIRENMKALKGTSEEKALTERYTRQLADQETRLETLRGEIAGFEAKRKQAQEQLDSLIEQMSMDVTL